jgi:hypothetical protein
VHCSSMRAVHALTGTVPPVPVPPVPVLKLPVLVLPVLVLPVLVLAPPIPPSAPGQGPCCGQSWYPSSPKSTLHPAAAPTATTIPTKSEPARSSLIIGASCRGAPAVSIALDRGGVRRSGASHHPAIESAPMKRFAGIAVAALALAPARAEAYRPFDGTDADVAEPRVFELELGPVNYFRQGDQAFLITPALVLNYGLGSNTELVIDANPYVALGKLGPGVPRGSLRDDDVFLKHLFREGTVQGKTGVSVAAEGGVLTPEINGVSGLGASLDVITSYQWWWGAFHWNEWVEYTRDHHAYLFSGVILEGPHAWTVRPVAELFYSRDFVSGGTGSVLVGAIWTASKAIALDAGLRLARMGDVNELEARLGLTWSIPTEGGPS